LLLRTVVEEHRVKPDLCLKVHDAHAWTAIDTWQDSSDKVLSRLSKNLLHRNFFKTVEIPDEFRSIVRNNWSQLEDVVRSRGYDPRYYLTLDTTVNRAFAPYAPEQTPLLPFIADDHTGGHINADIRIEQPNGQIVSIQEASPIVDMLTKVHSQVARLCFCAEVRDCVVQKLSELHVPVI